MSQTAVSNSDTDAPLMLSVSGARGLFGRSMTPAVAANFAAAFGSHLRETSETERPTVCLARDGRPSGGAIVAAASGGLLATGCRVIDLGVATTPSCGIMVQHLGADGGMVATASHNPIEWNGLKCIDHRGAAPEASIAASIVARFRHDGFAWTTPDDAPLLVRDDGAAEIHIERVMRLVDVAAIRAKAFTVVVDPVNASGSVIGRQLLKQLGCVVVAINDEPHGRFAHRPEPTEENLGELCDAVRGQPLAVVGFAQDPDADRLAIVDGDGRYIGEEYTLVLAALRMIAIGGAGPMAANMSTSRMLDDLAAAHPGASVVRSAVGEANVAAAMRACGARVGGEGNGGVIVPQVGWIRDSLVAMALVLDLLAAEDRTLAQIVDGLPRYRMLKHKIDLVTVGGIEAVAPAIGRVRAAFADQRVDTADGVRIDFDDGWVHLRPSNTEPVVRLIAESSGDGRAWELIDEVAVAAGLR